MVPGRCSMVLGRCLTVLGWCPIVSGRCSIVPERCSMVPGRCPMVLGGGSGWEVSLSLARESGSQWVNSGLKNPVISAIPSAILA